MIRNLSSARHLGHNIVGVIPLTGMDDTVSVVLGRRVSAGDIVRYTVWTHTAIPGTIPTWTDGETFHGVNAHACAVAAMARRVVDHLGADDPAFVTV